MQAASLNKMNSLATKKKPSHWSGIDIQMMSLALQLAEKGQYTARPNPMVGCVITQNTFNNSPQIVAKGWHQKSGQAHAEVNALKEAGEKSVGATCYVTLEPCSHTGKTGPCARALIKAGVSKVIASMLDPNPKVAGKGFQMLIDAGIEVEYGLLEKQARVLNRGFISRFERNRPWLTCKLAMSLDGRTALQNRASKWITGSASRADVQKLRARQDAIITGSGTVLADNPSLTIRRDDSLPRVTNWFDKACDNGFEQPARVLLDRQRSVDQSAKIFNQDADVYWIGDEFQKLQGNSEKIHHLSSFSSLFELLEYFSVAGMNNLLLESGHRLAGEFLKLGLIDELIVYMAPKLMGDRAMGLFDLNVQSMLQTPHLKLQDLRQFDEDIRLTYWFDNT